MTQLPHWMTWKLSKLLFLSLISCGHIDRVVLALDSIPEDLQEQIVQSVNEINSRMNCNAVSFGNEGTIVSITENCQAFNPENKMCFGIFKDDRIYIQRSTSSYKNYIYKTIFLHEVGHLFGLNHVNDVHQIMVSGLVWDTDDNKEPFLSEEQWDYYIKSLKDLGVCSK